VSDVRLRKLRESDIGPLVDVREHEYDDMTFPGGFDDEQRALLHERVAHSGDFHLGEYLFAADERSVAEIVLDLCRERGLTLGAAESATGGLIGQMLTAVPGASDVFAGAVVAYSNGVKRELLGVPEDVLEEHGAVSPQVAAAMARGVEKALVADVAVADTGIAGPGGGSADKPVGLVYLHALGPDGEIAQDFVARGGREDVRRRAAVSALHLLRRLLTQTRHASE